MWRIVYRECRDKVLFLNVFMCVSLNFHPVWRIFYIEYMDIFFQMCSHVFLEISILYKGFCTEKSMNVFLYVPLISHDLWKILDRECRYNFFYVECGLKWFFKLPLYVNDFVHKVQRYGFSSECVFMCIFKFL